MARQAAAMKANPLNPDSASGLILDWDNYPKLVRSRVDRDLERAIILKMEIAERQLELEGIKLRILSGMNKAIDDDNVKSMRYAGATFSRTPEGTSYKLDVKWAKLKLLMKGVDEEEIAENMIKVTREASLRILMPRGQAQIEGERDE